MLKLCMQACYTEVKIQREGWISPEHTWHQIQGRLTEAPKIGGAREELDAYAKDGHLPKLDYEVEYRDRLREAKVRGVKHSSLFA